MKKLITLAAFAVVCSGCEMVGGSYTTPGGAVVKIHRNACFWPSELANASLTFPAPTNTVAGNVSINGYKSTGGATELVPLLDSTGKIFGYVAQGAVSGVLPIK